MEVNGLRIRRAVAIDAPRIIAGIDVVCAEGGYFFTPHYVPTAQWEAALHRPQSVPDHLLLVAESDASEFVGATQLFPDPSVSQGNRLTGDLGIFVLRRFRGQGIGTALMGEILRLAPDFGYTRIVLSVLAANLRAIQLYHKFGFDVEHRRRREYAFLGEQDELIMARTIDGGGSRGVGDV